MKIIISLIFTAGILSAPPTPAKAELSRLGATIDNGVVAVTQSDSWGGAVVSLKFKGAEFIDVQDAGRELQFSEYCKAGWKALTTDGYTFTPKARFDAKPAPSRPAMNAGHILPPGNLK